MENIVEQEKMSKVTIEEIVKLRRSIRIGDVFKTEINRYNPKVDGLIERIWIKVKVVGRYPHLVEVVPVNISRTILPRMTMSYVEIAMLEGRRNRRV